jgi:hypothetical protein
LVTNQVLVTAEHSNPGDSGVAFVTNQIMATRQGPPIRDSLEVRDGLDNGHMQSDIYF